MDTLDRRIRTRVTTHRIFRMHHTHHNRSILLIVRINMVHRMGRWDNDRAWLLDIGGGDHRQVKVDHLQRERIWRRRDRHIYLRGHSYRWAGEWVAMDICRMERVMVLVIPVRMEN
jgi:hypothetical protein